MLVPRVGAMMVRAMRDKSDDVFDDCALLVVLYNGLPLLDVGTTACGV